MLDFRHPLAESCLLSSTGKACQSPCLQLNPEQRAALGVKSIEPSDIGIATACVCVCGFKRRALVG